MDEITGLCIESNGYVLSKSGREKRNLGISSEVFKVVH